MRPSNFSILSLSLTALLALVAAGCGGGGGGTTESTEKTVETTPSLTKAALIGQGDAICAAHYFPRPSCLASRVTISFSRWISFSVSSGP